MVTHEKYKESGKSLDTRVHVLRCSIAIESLASKLITTLLSVDDKMKSLALGNRSSEIPFEAKINLIHDLGYIEDLILNKYIRPVMRVRNKFLHSLEADSFGNATNKELKNDLLPKDKNFDGDELESRLLAAYDDYVEKSLAAIQSGIAKVEQKRAERNDILTKMNTFGILLFSHYRNSIARTKGVLLAMSTTGRITEDVRKELGELLSEQHQNFINGKPFKDYGEVVKDSEFGQKLEDMVSGKI